MRSRVPLALLLGAVLALSVQSCNLDVSPEDVRSAASPVRAVEPTPTVEITSPARASFLAPGPVVVEGRVGQAPGSTSPVVTTTVEGTVVQVPADALTQTDHDPSLFTGVTVVVANDNLTIADFAPVISATLGISAVPPKHQGFRRNVGKMLR